MYKIQSVWNVFIWKAQIYYTKTIIVSQHGAYKTESETKELILHSKTYE